MRPSQGRRAGRGASASFGCERMFCFTLRMRFPHAQRRRGASFGGADIVKLGVRKLEYRTILVKANMRSSSPYVR
jgi:hypothetical protein